MIDMILLYDLAIIAQKAGLIVTVFAITLGVAAYSTYGERKIAAFLQDRLGPSNAGPWGLLQPIADGVKMFTKEDFIPEKSERWLYILAPGAFIFVALMTSAVKLGFIFHKFGVYCAAFGIFCQVIGQQRFIQQRVRTFGIHKIDLGDQLLAGCSIPGIEGMQRLCNTRRIFTVSCLYGHFYRFGLLSLVAAGRQEDAE